MDAQKFLTIFDQYNGQIYGYVYLRVGRNKEIAEDLSQDIFMKAWQARDNFDETKASIKTWLFVIARNKVIDYWRERKVSNIDEQLAQQTSDAQEFELENAVLLAHIHTQLNLLDSAIQDLIIWRYILGLEIEEIGKLIDKNYNTTKVAIHRALQTLKSKINE